MPAGFPKVLYFACTTLLACQPTVATSQYEYWYAGGEEASALAPSCTKLSRIRGDTGTPGLIAVCPATVTAPGAPRRLVIGDGPPSLPLSPGLFVGRNFYVVKANARAAALAVRRRASDVRAAQGLERGTTFESQAASAPDFIWERRAKSWDEQTAEQRGDESPEFRAVQAEMRSLLTSFSQALYRVE